MALVQLTKEILNARPDTSTLFECRACGTSQFAQMGVCPSCESTDIVEYSFQ